MNLHTLDCIIIVVYAAIIGGIGLYLSRRQRSTSEYFVANRSIPSWAVAFTLMATLISSGTVVGHPATSYQSGLILLLGVLTLPVVLLFVARWIIPFYRNVVTMSAYEFLGKRFGIGGRTFASFGFLADRTFDVGVTLLTTAIPITLVTGWPLLWVILIVGVFTITYTAIGGIQAIVWTDVVQGVVLIVGAVVILARLLFAPEAGPFGAVLVEAYEQGKLSLGSFDFSWHSLTDTTQTTQWLLVIAMAMNWARRYTADQHMVQRYLLAKTDREAQQATMWNAYACVPIYVTFMLIGACLFGYYQLTSAPPPEMADMVVPHFIITQLPPGVVGLILIAILAASMSSTSSDINSMATVLTTDYFAQIFPNSQDKTRLFFGKMMVAVGGLAALLVAVMLIPDQESRSIMERGTTIAAILSGGSLGLFMLGYLTVRATTAGCYVGIGACVLFTAWGILTEPTHRLVDLGAFNFPFNPILIGVFGHFVLFGVGYFASLFLGTPKSATFETQAGDEGANGHA